jgi:hypothetical protein
MVAPKFSPALGFLRNLVVLPPVAAEGFQFFGLRLEPWHRRISGLHTLGEPLAGGLAIRVMELHHDPRSVWVSNESNRRIFLPAGERLPGSQGRRLRVSLVLAAQETLRLHAGLLEADSMASEPDASAGSRLPRNAAGAVIGRGGRVVSLHLFDRRETLRRLLPGILRRCEADTLPAGEPAALTREDVEAWLERVSSSRAQVRAAPGVGREVTIEESGLRGRCLLLDEGPVHAEIAVVALPAPLPAQAPHETTSVESGEIGRSRLGESTGRFLSPAAPPSDSSPPGTHPL